MTAIKRQLAIPALFVTFLVTIAAIGVHAREEGRRGASEPALAGRAVIKAETAAAASSQPPRPLREAETRAIPPSASAALATAPLDESALMQQLRAMRQSDPELSLRLAREGNKRLPTSPDAAERASIIVKSLIRMGRADEATAEAREMVKKYRGTFWALDVKRHMLDIPSYVPDAAGP